MNKDPFHRICLAQKLNVLPDRAELPAHHPNIFYIGCADARLDPIKHIGFEPGEAMIFRNIAALVPPSGRKDKSSIDWSSVADDGVVHEGVSLGAALEFFIRHITVDDKMVKHIIVAGHTDCGGIRTCLCQTYTSKDDYLRRYLSMLGEARNRVLTALPLASEEEQRRALEKESVKQSLANLRSYEFVSVAEKLGLIKLHGWILDTADKHTILEFDAHSEVFKPVGMIGQEIRTDGAGRG